MPNSWNQLFPNTKRLVGSGNSEDLLSPPPQKKKSWLSSLTLSSHVKKSIAVFTPSLTLSSHYPIYPHSHCCLKFFKGTPLPFGSMQNPLSQLHCKSWKMPQFFFCFDYFQDPSDNHCEPWVAYSFPNRQVRWNHYHTFKIRRNGFLDTVSLIVHQVLDSVVCKRQIIKSLCSNILIAAMSPAAWPKNQDLRKKKKAFNISTGFLTKV